MKKISSILASLCFVVVMSACEKDDPPLPDNTLNFETQEQGLASETQEAEIKLSLSRPADIDVAITVELQATGVTYGTDFTTTPAATANQLNLSIPKGSSSTSVKLTKSAGIFLSGTESVALIVKAVGSSAFKGTNNTLTLKFGSIVSSGSQLTLEGKTTASNYANGVYVDFSNNKQTSIDRKSWNLALYSGTEFRVVLNQGFQATAKALAKTDISTVGYADTVGIWLNHDINDPATKSLVDAWDGDLTKTAFAPVSATEAENKVYLVSFETNKTQDTYYKVKVSRNGNGYKVQYAKIGETIIKSLDVPKDVNNNFAFISLESNKTVAAEPAKMSWDIQWGYGTYDSGLGSPYWFQDLVLLNNLGGAQAAEVLTTAVTYDNFAEANIAAVTFLKTRDAIGSKWRQGAGPSGPGTIKRDRFYVVKDPSGNVYKLRFVSWGGGGDAGERGKPVIEYKLVKKA